MAKQIFLPFIDLNDPKLYFVDILFNVHENQYEILPWIRLNLRDEFCITPISMLIPKKDSGMRYIFKSESDATAFKLRWL